MRGFWHRLYLQICNRARSTRSPPTVRASTFVISLDFFFSLFSTLMFAQLSAAQVPRRLAAWAASTDLRLAESSSFLFLFLLFSVVTHRQCVPAARAAIFSFVSPKWLVEEVMTVCACHAGVVFAFVHMGGLCVVGAERRG